MSSFNTIWVRASLLLGMIMAGATFGNAAEQSEGQQLAVARCAACHSLEVPEPATLTMQGKIDGAGPPLHFSGQKYQQTWLTNWLQFPSRITPSGGDFWSNAVVVTEDGDEVDEALLKKHVALEAAQSGAVSDYLMTLKPHPQLTPDFGYTPAKVNMMLAKKDVRKFKGCSGCHRDTPDFGGVSGPELYTAMNRLQPDYIASYIANPRAWDPHTLMPAKSLNDTAIIKLMNYLNQIKEQTQ